MLAAPAESDLVKIPKPIKKILEAAADLALSTGERQAAISIHEAIKHVDDVLKAAAKSGKH